MSPSIHRGGCILGLLLTVVVTSQSGAAESAATCHARVRRRRHHLCVFVPYTTRTAKDVNLIRAALRSWARRSKQEAADVLVRYVGVADENGTELECHVLKVPGDFETDYKRLPIRILKMWEHLGLQRFDDCDWYMKADPDTFIHLRNVAERLRCFDSSSPQFLGVTHATVPGAELREWFSSLYFGQGGIGYIVSRALVACVGRMSDHCLRAALHLNRLCSFRLH
eukprot:TRINITY_DN58865_c0_g1_i1.p1 TRINITY_DN58865_c0_g1~~TRINITY_DN58865_c0_g1_i1.p1  ORF type:complete len:263 (-),score=28.97 TRINITY_DN58865_c0_g1_i1:43-717(-)